MECIARSLQDAKRSARWISEYLGEPALALTVTKLLANQSAGWSRSSNPFIEGGNQVRGVTILNANIVLGACLWSGAAYAQPYFCPRRRQLISTTPKCVGTLEFFPHSKLLLRTY